MRMLYAFLIYSAIKSAPNGRMTANTRVSRSSFFSGVSGLKTL